jgi:hypothetical protein
LPTGGTGFPDFFIIVFNVEVDDGKAVEHKVGCNKSAPYLSITSSYYLVILMSVTLRLAVYAVVQITDQGSGRATIRDN